VQKLISRYNRFGVSAIETKGKGGRKREYLTVEQERQFLEPFFVRAKAGEIATVGEIHRVEPPLTVIVLKQHQIASLLSPVSF
jgi:hypothetical protein